MRSSDRARRSRCLAASVRRSGLGLLEAIVALVVLSLTAISALAGAAGQVDAMRRARLHLQATVLVDHRLEQVRLLTPEELLAAHDSIRYGRFQPPLDEFTWEVTSVPLGGSTHHIEVRVIVRHAEVSAALATRMYRRSEAEE